MHISVIIHYQSACQPHRRNGPPGRKVAQDEGNQRGGYQLQEDHLREMDSCAKRPEQHRETRGNQVNIKSQEL